MRSPPSARAAGATAALAAILSLGGTRAAVAQSQYRLEYAAKIVCGAQQSLAEPGLVPQTYGTTINVHNPNGVPVAFLKRLALSIPPGMQQPGKIVRIALDTLRTGEALAVDCADLRKRVPALPNFFEGFLVIHSPASLDVVGVYAVPGGIAVQPVAERAGGVVPPGVGGAPR